MSKLLSLMRFLLIYTGKKKKLFLLGQYIEKYIFGQFCYYNKLKSMADFKRILVRTWIKKSLKSLYKTTRIKTPNLDQIKIPGSIYTKFQNRTSACNKYPGISGFQWKSISCENTDPVIYTFLIGYEHHIILKKS